MSRDLNTLGTAGPDTYSSPSGSEYLRLVMSCHICIWSPTVGLGTTYGTMDGLLCHVIYDLIKCVNWIKRERGETRGFRGYFCEK